MVTVEERYPQCDHECATARCEGFSFRCCCQFPERVRMMSLSSLVRA